MKTLKVATIIDNELNLNSIIDDSIESLQTIVDGYIECPQVSSLLSDNGIDIYINDSGKINGLPITAVVIDSDLSILDTIHGNIIFAGHDNDGNTISLNDTQIGILSYVFNRLAYLNNDNKVYVIPVN